MPSKRLRSFTFKLPNEYYLALIHLAKLESHRKQRRITPGWYLRHYVVKEHLRRKREARPGVDLLTPFMRTVKDYIATCQGIRIAGSLPAESRRKELEEITWKAIQQAYAHSQTEDAATNAEARHAALLVLGGLLKTERAILHDQDDAFVNQLIEELEAEEESFSSHRHQSDPRPVRVLSS